MTVATDERDEIPPGSRWMEVRTNRVIVIIGPGPDSPWWYYEDRPREQWHCSIYDFFLTGRFKRLT